MSGFDVEFFKFDGDDLEKKAIEVARKKFRARLELMLPEILKEDPNAKIIESDEGFPQLEARISKELREKLKGL